MHTAFRWITRLLGLGLVVVAALAINVAFFRPLSVDHFYDKVFVKFALDNPMMLSGIRILEGLGIRAHNAELGDISPAKAEQDFATIRSIYDDLHKYDRDKLTGQTAMSFDILSFFLEQQAQAEKFMWHDYPVTQLGGVQSNLPDFMSGIHHLGDGTDCEHYIARLNLVPEFFQQAEQQLDKRAEVGVVTPRFALEGALQQVNKFLDTAPQDNVLYATYMERIGKLDDEGKADCEALGPQVLNALTTSVRPAYEQLGTRIESLLQTAEGNHGVWSLPDGDEYYAVKLREHTTTDITPQRVHELGLAEVARIGAEMDAILTAEGYTEGSVGQRMSALAQEDRFRFPNTDEGREAALEEYRRIIRDIETGMSEMFDLTIESPMEVRRIPEFREDGAPGAYYQGPAQDGSRPGVFYANLRNMDEVPKYGMRTLAYHEAVPGHHYQTALQTELKDVAMLRRLLGFTAFAEGWALYAERLAWEQGFQTDPYDNLGRLQDEMMRAVRLVVDSGLHYKRWTREQAIDYMHDNTGQDRASVTTEIERYLVWPGQATAYKIGMLKILELRERARDALGEKFDIRAFHRTVLENGDIPLFLLEQQVDAYIARVGRS
ncbi:MAG: DUF885 domain-containing protein [Pseudomonadota bacterium]